MAFGRDAPQLKKSFAAGDWLIYAFMILFAASTLFPFVYLLSMSLTSSDVSLTRIRIVPEKIDFGTYLRVLADEQIQRGFLNTLVRTGLGTLLTVTTTILMAYPLSKRYFPNRVFWTALVVFTMYFSGGLIPTYLLYRSFGIFDSVWVLVLPYLVNAFHLVIVRNFMMTIPESLEESARIDGANDVRILVSIIIPVSLPIIATLVLWTAVWHWNAWFDAMIYISSGEKMVLQTVLRKIVITGKSRLVESNAMNPDVPINPVNLKAASIIIVTIPIVMIYPFLQKYFIKGIFIGSLKG